MPSAQELLVLIFRQCLGATLGSCHLFNQWVLVMRCVGWGTVSHTCAHMGSFAAVSHSSPWQVSCGTDSSGIRTLTPHSRLEPSVLHTGTWPNHEYEELTSEKLWLCIETYTPRHALDALRSNLVVALCV